MINQASCGMNSHRLLPEFKSSKNTAFQKDFIQKPKTYHHESKARRLIVGVKLLVERGNAVPAHTAWGCCMKSPEVCTTLSQAFTSLLRDVARNYSQDRLGSLTFVM
jgi:hypothetical protein